MTDTHQRILRDLDALARVRHRHAGTDGEREMVQAVRGLRGEGAPARVEGFVSHLKPDFWVGVHAALLLAAGALGYFLPGLGVLACGVVTLSLVGEGLGRFKLIRWFAPTSPSYNLVVHRAVSEPLGALVLVAPLDTPLFRSPWARGSARGSAFRPMQVLFWAAVVVTALLALRSLAEPWGRPSGGMYVAGLIVLAGSVALGAFALRGSDPVEEAGAEATLLELERRFADRPLERVELWIVWTGCGRAFEGGMAAFLDLHGPHLPDPALVIALDDTGRAPLRATLSEGPLFRQTHRPTGPALVERLGWAGVRVELVDLPAATNARAAQVRGLRALALVGGEGAVSADEVARAADVTETLARWYAEDLVGVAASAQSLEGLAAATQASAPVRNPRFARWRGART
jgi:hypothetical protein